MNDQDNKQILQAMKHLAEASGFTLKEVIERVELGLKYRDARIKKDQEEAKAREEAERLQHEIWTRKQAIRSSLDNLVGLISKDPHDAELTSQILGGAFMEKVNTCTPLEGIQSLVARRN